jgi:uncharacterized LabA/DUF88 family protein
MIHTDHRPNEQDSLVGGPKSETTEALLRSGEQAPQVAFYADGFNLYHAIDDLGDHRLKWLDLKSLCQSFLQPGDQLTAVHFFTALSRWDIGKRERHLDYIRALQHTGVEVRLGTFDRPSKFCWEKNGYCRNYHEKKTDVAIAVTMIADGFENKYDKAFLISADSDQVPLAERMMSSLPQKRLFLITPPGRMPEARELTQTIGRPFNLTAGRIRQHLLPSEFRAENGKLIVARPARYAVSS